MLEHWIVILPSYLLYAWEIFDYHNLLSTTLNHLDDSVGASDASVVASVTNPRKRKVLSLLRMDGANASNLFHDNYKEEFNNAVKESIQI